MKKFIFIIFGAIALSAAAAAPAKAQGIYYYPYWSPFDYYYYGPVVVYDPVRMRQMEAIDSLKKLNRAALQLTTAANETVSIKEVEKRAEDVAKYAKRLRGALNEGEADRVEPGYLGAEAAALRIPAAAARINELVAQLNNTDIDLGDSINLTRRRDTLMLLAEIEANARAVATIAERARKNG